MTATKPKTRIFCRPEEAAGALIVAVDPAAAAPADLAEPTGVDPGRLLRLAAAGAAGFAIAPAQAEAAIEYLAFVCLPQSSRDDALAELRLRAMRAVAALPPGVTAAAIVPPLAAPDPAAAFEPLCEGVLAGSYRLGENRLLELGAIGDESLAPALERVATIAAATAWVRSLVDTPSSELRPADFAGRALDLAAAAGLEASTWSPDQLLAERMAGLLAVSRGSASPTMVDLSFGSDPEAPLLVLVGKAITFDAGGMQAKQARMEWNKADMAGGAAVLAAAWAVAELGLPLRLRVLVPCAENLGGTEAYRPGDVIRHRNGRSSEVRFTDGEGRLVLADVLDYASELEAAAVVDVATLTSPYGPRMWGYAANDESLAAELAAASAAAGEPAYRVPLHHGYLDEIESPIADLANYVSVPGAANDHAGLRAITAALFLEPFAAGRAWAHIDIAGTAFHLRPGAGWPAGATGCTVATLVRLAMRFAGATSAR